MFNKNISDPKVYELTITLLGNSELIEDAEFGRPAGFVLNSAASGATQQAVTLVEKRRTTRMKVLPTPPQLNGEAGTAVAANVTRFSACSCRYPPFILTPHRLARCCTSSLRPISLSSDIFCCDVAV
ncbi:hypothetical protein [Hydrogenophaga sp. PAMC20947]|uniref:hypothetical protein n=1 Tax=Hydrogenophaga sp. PAMC20947 TaxID=2565558 RepID=UPI00109E104C|nr:hypothetical protein [Hydrogenophaga sp. PAMC20947]QCB44898.1 hypothetical protein E5678_01905 [Hydrogenophaga sp. PAMC20947]